MDATTKHRPLLTVVGGGLAGLAAAITAAEAGAQVHLLEAHAELGGRARSSPPPHVANDGPHVLYGDGAAWGWLRERGLHRPYRRLPLATIGGMKFRVDGRLRRTPPAGLVRLLAKRSRSAPVDVDFRTWVTRSHGEAVAALASNAAAVVTFTSDPGRLSADFVWTRLLRSTNPTGGPRYVGGGWGGLVTRMAARARDLGVDVQTGARVDRVEQLPAGLVVVATSLAAARVLLDRPLATPAIGGSTALLDVTAARRRGDAFLVSDLDDPGWAEQFSCADPGLAPEGRALFQVQVPVRSGENAPAAAARAAALLQAAAPGWAERTVWQRRATAHHRSGALDLPGHTWRDRPAVDQGDGVFLAGDEVAAAGMLSEVSFTSAVHAADAALAACSTSSTVSPTRPGARRSGE